MLGVHPLAVACASVRGRALERPRGGVCVRQRGHVPGCARSGPQGQQGAGQAMPQRPPGVRRRGLLLTYQDYSLCPSYLVSIGFFLGGFFLPLPSPCYLASFDFVRLLAYPPQSSFFLFYIWADSQVCKRKPAAYRSGTMCKSSGS